MAATTLNFPVRLTFTPNAKDQCSYVEVETGRIISLLESMDGLVEVEGTNADRIVSRIAKRAEEGSRIMGRLSEAQKADERCLPAISDRERECIILQQILIMAVCEPFQSELEAPLLRMQLAALSARESREFRIPSCFSPDAFLNWLGKMLFASLHKSNEEMIREAKLYLTDPAPEPLKLAIGTFRPPLLGMDRRNLFSDWLTNHYPECPFSGESIHVLLGAAEQKTRLDRLELIGAETGDDGDSVEYVSLDQIAAIVKRSKARIEQIRPKLGDPDVEGGGGYEHLWKYLKVKPILEKRFGLLPDCLPDIVRELNATKRKRKKTDPNN